MTWIMEYRYSSRSSLQIEIQFGIRSIEREPHQNISQLKNQLSKPTGNSSVTNYLFIFKVFKKTICYAIRALSSVNEMIKKFESHVNIYRTSFDIIRHYMHNGHCL